MIWANLFSWLYRQLNQIYPQIYTRSNPQLLCFGTKMKKATVLHQSSIGRSAKPILLWLHYAECHHKHWNSLAPKILCVKNGLLIHHLSKVINPNIHFHAQISALITDNGSNRALYWFVSQTVSCKFQPKTAVMFNVAKLVDITDAFLYTTRLFGS